MVQGWQEEVLLSSVHVCVLVNVCTYVLGCLCAFLPVRMDSPVPLYIFKQHFALHAPAEPQPRATLGELLS